MVLCYVKKLLELTGSQCRSCPLQRTITTWIVECALVMKMKCSAGHVFTWSSSPVIRNANRHAIYKANLVFASALLFSGNNYYSNFMHVNCISPSTFFTYQQLVSAQWYQILYQLDIKKMYVIYMTCVLGNVTRILFCKNMMGRKL